MPSAPPTTYSLLAHELADRDAVGFVSVADRTDPSHRYLTRYQGPPDTQYAFVFVDGRSYLCAPEGDGQRASREFAGTSVVHASDQDVATPGQRAVDVLRNHDVDGTVLVPAHIPHDAVVYLQQAGFDVASTNAVTRARAEKSRPELDCLAAVQDTAGDAMAAVESALARAEIDGHELRLDGRSITTGRLRHIANATLADSGVKDAQNTIVAAGRAAARPRFQGDLPVRPGTTVVVVLRPRGPHGYHGFLARTFAPDSDGGWERRAHLAATGARDAGIDALEPGASWTSVTNEIEAEALAFGFEPTGGASRSGSAPRSGFDGATIHGVGLSPMEAPEAASNSSGESGFAAGQVLAVGARIVDPDEGCVWVGDLAFVTDSGAVVPVDAPDDLVPRDQRSESNRP